MSEEAEYELRSYIFLYRKDKKQWAYFLLNKDFINDGREAEGETVHYSVRLGAGNSGVIYEISTKIGTHQISYGKFIPPKGYWKNTKQVTEWQTRNRAFEDLDKLKQIANTDMISKTLEPIREAYLRTHNRQERTIIIARVIDYITYGK